MKSPKKGAATTALVLGISSAALSPIPILNNVGIIAGVLALGFATYALFGVKKGTAVTAIALSVAGVVVSLILQAHWTSEINKQLNDLDKAIATLDQVQP